MRCLVGGLVILAVYPLKELRRGGIARFYLRSPWYHCGTALWLDEFPLGRAECEGVVLCHAYGITASLALGAKPGGLLLGLSVGRECLALAYAHEACHDIQEVNLR